MKHWGRLTLCLLLFTTGHQAGAQNAPGRPLCLQQANYGGKRLCLPRVRAYEECSAHPFIANLTEAGTEGNTMHGFYLDTALFHMLEQQPLLTNYWKVYTTDALANSPMQSADLHEAADEIALYFVREHWLDIRQEVLSGQFTPLQRPVLLGRYSPEPDVVSLSLLVELPADGTPLYALYNLNMLLIQQRLVWMSYHQLLRHENQLQELREQSDALVQLLMEANP